MKCPKTYILANQAPIQNPPNQVYVLENQIPVVSTYNEYGGIWSSSYIIQTF